MKKSQPKTHEDMQEAIKNIFSPMLEVLILREMDSHLGYDAYERANIFTTNLRNIYEKKSA